MRLAPPDTWPELRVTIRLLPWHWRIRPRLYHDFASFDGRPSFDLTVSWLFVTIDFLADRPLFTEKAA